MCVVTVGNEQTHWLKTILWEISMFFRYVNIGEQFNKHSFLHVRELGVIDF